MSKSPTSIECKYPDCDEFGNVWEFRHGKYCSSECDTRHEGRQALNEIRYDHRRCFTCFRELKTVNPPKPDFEFTKNGHGWTFTEDGEPTLQYYSQEVTRKAAIGFQFRTEHATIGEKQRGDRVVTGTICLRCGNTEPTDHLPLLSNRDAIGRLVTLLSADDDAKIDPHALHREYDRANDLDLAVGRALL